MKEKIDTNNEESRFRDVPYIDPRLVEEYQDESHPDFERGWEKNPAVWQGNGKLVEGGKVYSDGFSRCTAFVIKNPDSRWGGMFMRGSMSLILRRRVSWALIICWSIWFFRCSLPAALLSFLRGRMISARRTIFKANSKALSDFMSVPRDI